MADEQSTAKAEKVEKPKIESLTPEQDAKLEVYYQKWLAVGLQTGPRDHATIENALRKVYTCAGLEPPKEFIWADSPVACARLVDKQVGDRSGDPGHAGYGTHDASWLALYAFMRNALGLVEETQELVGLIEAAEAGLGWYWPFENVCFVSELPSALQFDAEGRLHCHDGPAIAYIDGTEVYAWHDVIVDRDIIMSPEKITAERITGEQNAEIRRVLLDRFGTGKYIEAMGLKPIHEDETGQLYRAELQGDPEPLVMVRVIDTSTGRPYFLRVPPEMTTAKQAVAWTFDVKPQEYNPGAQA